MEFSRAEYWSGSPFPSPEDLPNPWAEPRSPVLQADSLPAEPQWKPKNTGVGNLSLLQRICLTQESNWGLLHCRRILYQLSYQGSPDTVPGYSQILTLTLVSVPVTSLVTSLVTLLVAMESLCLIFRFSTPIPYTPTKLFSSRISQSLNLFKVSLFSSMSAHSNSRPCSSPTSFKVWISVAFHLYVQKRNHSFLPYFEHLVPMP